jgi:ubiquinone/menaquinone biosynthesis C-methylase UbiE
MDMMGYRENLEKSADTERHSLSLYKEFEEIVLKYIKGKVLEIVCGDGAWIGFLKKHSERLVSIDLSEKRIKIARQADSRVEFILCDARNLPFKSESFDTICAFEVIEHLPNYTDHLKFLSGVRNILSREDVFLISTPNKPIYDIYRKLTKDCDLTHFSELSYLQFKKILKDFFPLL